MDVSKLKAAVPALLSWYDLHERPLPWRQNPTPYRIWISEIMLQQTRVEAVIPHYYDFLQKIPDIRTLAAIPEEELLKFWEGLGYYSRARNLQKAAKAVVADGKQELPTSYRELLKLPGIGAYTAGAIASIAFQEPVPAVDGNVMRVAARLTADSTDVLSPAGKQHFTALVTSLLPEKHAGRFNQAIMELGETVCLPNATPHCEVCPFGEVCLGNQKGIAAQLPVRQKPKPRRKENLTVLLLVTEPQNGSLLLHQRPKSGLLAGLYEFPNLPGTLDAEEAVNALNARGFTVHAIQPTPEARHIFTHIEWEMTGYMAVVSKVPPGDGYRWVSKTELEEKYALPTAFKPFLSYLQKLNF